MSYNETETGVMLRKTIYDVAEIKRQILSAYDQFEASQKEMDDLFQSINSYSSIRTEITDHRGGKEYSALVDKKCWTYFIQIYELKKYMLCTEFEKLEKQIEAFDFPEYTIENAEAWLANLKSLIYENVQKLIEDVYARITGETYWTGSGYSTRVKKKRNNNGIDKHFIISTGDMYSIQWYSSRPTITDDLEKACYIIDGKLLPQSTIKETMRRNKIFESENEYFRIRICHNGNTHYWINDKIRERLNFYGARRGVIGENIKIKIFEKDY